MKSIFVILTNLIVIVALITSIGGLRADAASLDAAPESPRNMKLLNQFGGLVSCVTVRGNYAYVGEGPRMLIFDIATNPGHLITKSQSKVLAGTVDGILVTSNGVAYVAASDGGIYVFDVTDVTDPIASYHVDTPGPAKKISLSGDYLYLAGGSSGLLVYQGVNQDEPVYAANVSMTDALDVVLQGNYAYVADITGSVWVINITNPLVPSFLKSYSASGAGRGLATDGSYLYQANFDGGLFIYSYSANGDLTLKGHYQTGTSQTAAVKVLNGYAYLAEGSHGMTVVDVHDKTNPILYGTLLIAGWFTAGIDASGSYAYLASGDFGFRVANISNPANPSMTNMGSMEPDVAYARRMSISGQQAYVTNDNSGKSLGMRIIDLSIPGSPFAFGTYNSPGFASGVAAFSFNGTHYAYLADTTALEILNVDNHNSPQLVKSFPASPAHSYDNVWVVVPRLLAPSALVCDLTANAVWLWDLTDPENPGVSGSVDLGPGSPQEAIRYGSYTYVADGSGGLRILDFSAEPYHEAGHLTLTGYALNVAVSGSKAYVAAGAGGLRIVDVSTASDPHELGAYTADIVEDVQVVGSLAYLSTGNGVRVLDVSDPLHLHVVASYPARGSNSSIATAVVQNMTHIYMTSVSNGFYEFLTFRFNYLPLVKK